MVELLGILIRKAAGHSRLSITTKSLYEYRDYSSVGKLGSHEGVK